MPNPGDIRILLCADTHLGFDEPIRPRVERRRRGADFFDNFQRVLDGARERRVDLVIHGGDLFFRSRVPPSIVDRVYRMLQGFAAGGIPIAIVPGNHERAVLPSSLFLSHPNIHVFAQPETKVFDLAGTRIALTGIPSAGRDARRRFRPLLERTAWADIDCDLRFLCLHEAIEGARVSGYTFQSGADVIAKAELPPAFDAVLAGHIHRRQILERPRPDGTSMPILYPGSIERTSFAERLEPKGFYEITVHAPSGARPEGDRPGRRRLSFEFRELPARPMHEIVCDPGLCSRSDVREFLVSRLAALEADSVVRLRWGDRDGEGEGGVPTGDLLTSDLLREVGPATMTIQFGGPLSGRVSPPPGRDVPASGHSGHSGLDEGFGRRSPDR